MKRFQKAYKEHLKKQDEKSTLELRELVRHFFALVYNFYLLLKQKS